jgi:hypothetical protein
MKNKFIFTILTLLALFTSISYALDVRFDTPVESALNTNDFIYVNIDDVTDVTCNLSIGDSSETLFTPTSTSYAVYYSNLSYGQHTFNLECTNGVDTEEVSQIYVVPEKYDTFPYLLVFILALITPLLVKAFGLIQIVSRDNPYMEFVIYTGMLALFFVYGTPISMFYYEPIFLLGKAIAGMSMVLSLWFIIVKSIQDFNTGGNR